MQNALTTTARRAAVLAAAGAAAVSLAGLGMGSASAVVGTNLPDACLQFSANNGASWGDINTLAWTGNKPSPGNEVLQSAFKVKNNCDTPAKFQAYAGNWALPDGGSAFVRANAGSVVGTPKNLTGDPGILVVESNRLTKGTPIDVKLFVGIPASETKQAFTIKPDWSTALEEVAGDSPTDPVDPVDPTDPDDCSDSSASGSASGSLGSILGPILCSDTSSLGGSSAPKLIQLDSPTVVAANR